MRAIWINEGAEVNSYDRLRNLGFNQVFWSERNHTRAHLEQARREGFEVGVYSNPQWYGHPDPKTYRTVVNQRLTALGVNDEQCDFQINYEVHNPAWITEFFYWWRRVRQTRPTSWTMEGFQGGWAWRAMNHPNLLGNPDDPRTVVTLVPQAYDGNMNAYDTAGTIKDLVDHGVDYRRIVPFVDAPEATKRGFYGFAYMEHRLP